MNATKPPKPPLVPPGVPAPTPRPVKPRFTFTVEALPGEVPAIIRLRGALKTLLRSFGLRCVEIEEVTERE